LFTLHHPKPALFSASFPCAGLLLLTGPRGILIHNSLGRSSKHLKPVHQARLPHHHCRGEPFDINTREEPSLSTTAGERDILIQPSRPIIYASEARQSSPASPH
ncbi:unnamed protein product, partial [Pylaiella littoralis]